MDRYAGMIELLEGVPREGHWSLIVVEDRRSAVRLFAPHGGCIEPCTGPVVSELAGAEYDYYIFRGEMRRDCFRTLHVTSTRYDQPDCVRLAAGAMLAVSVHGRAGEEAVVEVGGGNPELALRLREELAGAGYDAVPGPAGMAGADPRNFVNLCALGGVQLELSAGFRRRLFPGFPRDAQRHPVEFRRFIAVLRRWLKEVESDFPRWTEAPQ